MIVMHLMKKVALHMNAFVWRRGLSQIITPLTTLEGVALDFNLHFRVIFGEFLQTFEG